jgi:hypothetical protein
MEELGSPKVFTLEQLFQEVGVGVAPGTKLQVAAGDTVRVTATIEYMGPALSDTFRAAIGTRGFAGFDEILVGQVGVTLGPSLTAFTTYTLTVNIPITSAISPGTNYDLYVKLAGHTGAGMPEVDDVIDVVGAPTFQNFRITDYSKV